jgi:hypothetical protein
MIRAMSTDVRHDSATHQDGWRVFYHMVATDPPTVDDFRSNHAKGRVPRRPLTAEEQDLWEGISAYETWSLARRKAGASPWLGEYIAELHIPARSAIRARRTTTSRGHWTLWGDPEDLLGCVVSVAPMRAPDAT